jgi:HAD superfamily hydrolase (TIGR01509 family)
MSSPLSPAPRAILFDVDGTLYSQRWLRARLLLRLAGRAALEPRLVRVLWFHRKALETLRHADRSVAIPDRQFQLTAELAGVPEERVRRIVQEWFVEAPLPLLRSCIRPGLAGLLRLARDRGIPLGVFSDYEAEDKLKALGVREFFDVVTSSEDPAIQAYKPNPKGLLVTLARLGVAPGQAIYIGDRPEVDAEAARRAGMRAVIVGRAHGFPEFRRLLEESLLRRE